MVVTWLEFALVTLVIVVLKWAPAIAHGYAASIAVHFFVNARRF